MRKLERLRIEALESCNFRGHNMGPFNRKYRHWWSSECKNCGMSVNIIDDVLPNGIDIYGKAVALHCTQSNNPSLGE